MRRGATCEWAAGGPSFFRVRSHRPIPHPSSTSSLLGTTPVIRIVGAQPQLATHTTNAHPRATPNQPAKTAITTKCHTVNDANERLLLESQQICQEFLSIRHEVLLWQRVLKGGSSGLCAGRRPFDRARSERILPIQQYIVNGSNMTPTDGGMGRTLPKPSRPEGLEKVKTINWESSLPRGQGSARGHPQPAQACPLRQRGQPMQAASRKGGCLPATPQARGHSPGAPTRHVREAQPRMPQERGHPQQGARIGGRGRMSLARRYRAYWWRMKAPPTIRADGLLGGPLAPKAPQGPAEWAQAAKSPLQATQPPNRAKGGCTLALGA